MTTSCGVVSPRMIHEELVVHFLSNWILPPPCNWTNDTSSGYTSFVLGSADVVLMLGSISVHNVFRASAHESPLKMAIDVAACCDDDDKSDTTSLLGEYEAESRGKLKATPG